MKSFKRSICVCAVSVLLASTLSVAAFAGNGKGGGAQDGTGPILKELLLGGTGAGSGGGKKTGPQDGTGGGGKKTGPQDGSGGGANCPNR
ncbi:MAG: hypothetical protein LBJ21_05090 [Acidobacteriota bacterium]|jgi:hypothetical protein|nr:hypothetical protein [Acidobacteriota bacterium]